MSSSWETPEAIWQGAARASTAAAVMFDADGQVLLVKHSYGPLNWELPGGAAEPDETPVQTALRELREESGLDATAECLTGIYYELLFAFRCRLKDATSKPTPSSREITHCVYWPLDNLPRPMTDFTLRRIDDAVRGVPGLLPVTIGPRQLLP